MVEDKLQRSEKLHLEKIGLALFSRFKLMSWCKTKQNNHFNMQAWIHEINFLWIFQKLDFWQTFQNGITNFNIWAFLWFFPFWNGYFRKFWFTIIHLMLRLLYKFLVVFSTLYDGRKIEKTVSRKKRLKFQINISWN